MSYSLNVRTKQQAACILGWLGLCLVTAAFPPAPHHTLHGMVRNQWGDPINIFPSQVFLESPSGTQLHVEVVSGLAAGSNYRLEVPMDSSAAADLYKPTAMRPFFQFKLKVQMGQTTYLPIEMAGDFSQMGQPGQATRIDLTLGVDSDGDGLPDAWEQALISVFGGTLASINPNDDSDGDGISNLNEYLAGTYAFDPTDGFSLAILGQTDGSAQMEFVAIRGRTYTVQASSDLQQWAPVDFRVLTGSVPGTLQANYVATDVRLLRVEVPYQSGAETNRYFRALVR